MKILHLSSTDINGGAARAAFRLHRALRDQGHESFMLVGRKSSRDEWVIEHHQGKPGYLNWKLRRKADKFPLRRFKNVKSLFSVNWLPDGLFSQIKRIQPDIVHLHWVGQGYVSLRTLQKLQLPLVWTLHDMWPFTGGCHYSGECTRYQTQCGACPVLGSQEKNDISRSRQEQKKRALTGKDLIVVTPSRWLGDCAKSSEILEQFRVETIPYNLDLAIYSSISKTDARKQLGLPEEKRIILFGAMSATSDPRKGFNYLLEALKKLPAETNKNIDILVYGATSPALENELTHKIHYAGVLSDEQALVTCYSAADIFVAPSTEDNLPLTVMEALSCSTPVVAFDIGGMPDMISHRINGYLARPFETDDLRAGIEWSLENSERLRIPARSAASELFNDERITADYLKLYTEVRR